MKTEHKLENQKFFLNVINTLAEGGKYIFIEIGEVFIKKGDKLHCYKKGYNRVKEIVTDEFLIQNFQIVE